MNFPTSRWARGPFRAEFSTLVGELLDIVASYVSDYAPHLEILKTHSPRQVANFIIALILGVSTQYLAEGKDKRALETIDILKAAIK